MSTAKMMTIATPPVTTVVTMPLIAVRSASLEMRATAMGFHTQVNRLMTRKTAPYLIFAAALRFFPARKKPPITRPSPLKK